MKKISLLLFVCSLYGTLCANKSCLTYQEGVCTEDLMPVPTCACPCDRYKHTDRRNKCVKCGHYRGDEALKVVRTRNNPSSYPRRYIQPTRPTR